MKKLLVLLALLVTNTIFSQAITMKRYHPAKSQKRFLNKPIGIIGGVDSNYSRGVKERRQKWAVPLKKGLRTDNGSKYVGKVVFSRDNRDGVNIVNLKFINNSNYRGVIRVVIRRFMDCRIVSVVYFKVEPYRETYVDDWADLTAYARKFGNTSFYICDRLDLKFDK